jgi:hypothetical protein
MYIMKSLDLDVAGESGAAGQKKASFQQSGFEEWSEVDFQRPFVEENFAKEAHSAVRCSDQFYGEATVDI